MGTWQLFWKVFPVTRGLSSISYRMILFYLTYLYDLCRVFDCNHAKNLLNIVFYIFKFESNDYDILSGSKQRIISRPFNMSLLNISCPWIADKVKQ